MAPTVEQQQLYFNQLQSSLNGVYTHIGRVFDAAQRKGDSGVMGQSKIIISTFRNNFQDALDELEYELNQARTVMRRDLALHIEARRRKEEEEKAKLNPPPVPGPEVSKKTEDTVMADAPAADADADVNIDDLFDSKPGDATGPPENATKVSDPTQHSADQPRDASKQQQPASSAPADAAMTDSAQPIDADALQLFDLDATFDEIRGGKASDDLTGGQYDGDDMGDFLSGLEGYGNTDALGTGESNDAFANVDTLDGGENNANNETITNLSNSGGLNNTNTAPDDITTDDFAFLTNAADDATGGDPMVDNTFDDLFTFDGDDFNGDFGELGNDNNNAS